MLFFVVALHLKPQLKSGGQSYDHDNTKKTKREPGLCPKSHMKISWGEMKMRSPPFQLSETSEYATEGERSFSKQLIHLHDLLRRIMANDSTVSNLQKLDSLLFNVNSNTRNKYPHEQEVPHISAVLLPWQNGAI